LGILEAFKRHSGAECRMASAHDANIAFVEHQTLQESRRQIVEKSSGKVDRTRAERRARIVKGNWQDARRYARCLVLQEFEQRGQEYRLPDIVHEEAESSRARQRIEEVICRKPGEQRIQCFT